MSEEETIKLRQFAKILLTEMGYKPKKVGGYVSENEAVKILRPVKIGRVKLKGYVDKKIVRIKEEPEYKSRNQVKRLYREDVYKLLNSEM